MYVVYIHIRIYVAQCPTVNQPGDGLTRSVRTVYLPSQHLPQTSVTAPTSENAETQAIPG